MNDLTGTGALIRLILRRDRIRISIWVVSIALVVFLTAVGVRSLFPTQASIDQAAAATQQNAGAIAFNGPAQGLDTLGGQIAFQVGALGMVVVALMSIFMIGRLTRGDEEAGRLELVRSLPVGIHAPALAALITLVGMNVAVAVLVFAALSAEGLPTAGSLVLGASFAAVGLFFTGVALVAAQISQNTRVVYGSSGALLGLAYVMRIVGDIGDGTVSWFSPIGLAQKTRPFAGERWWPLLPLLLAALALIAVALRLAIKRDYGAGLVAPRPGRIVATRSLGHPLGLAMRLQRGALFGWGGGVLVTGIAYGSIAPTIDSFVANNKAMAELLASAGIGNLADTYFATSFRVMALIASGFAIQSALRLRSEESALRAEPVLATPVSRSRWAASHLTIALAGSVGLLAVAGLATGVSYAMAGGPWSSVPRLLGAAVVYAPAIWLMIGLVVIVFGFAPRWVDVAWGILAACSVIGLLGVVLRLPDWVQKLSPFERTPALPAANMAVLPLVVLTALAAVSIFGGLGGLRRRDIG
ncbi:MAG TPA: ABC transporter permease [Candidatus Dormibacteraeota bacterium]